jgi:hypothetical protein
MTLNRMRFTRHDASLQQAREHTQQREPSRVRRRVPRPSEKSAALRAVASMSGRMAVLLRQLGGLT